MPVKLLVLVIIVFKRYPSTYCLMQGSCFICRDFWNLNSLSQSLRITTFNIACIRVVFTDNVALSEIMYIDIWNHVYWYLKPCILMFESLKSCTLIFETTYIDIWNHVYWCLKPRILMFETTYIDFETMYIDVWNHVHWYLKPRILMFETTYIDIWNPVHWYLKPRTLIFETTYIDIWNYVYWCLKPRILTFETSYIDVWNHKAHEMSTLH